MNKVIGVDLLTEKQKNKTDKSQKTEEFEKAEPKLAIDHVLVPRHEIIPPEETKELLERLKVKQDQFPKIFTSDPAIQYFAPKIGSIIKIIRKSATAGTATYYRLVVESDAMIVDEENEKADHE